jgi:HAD superfamily hydrolase (TIGR01509 family)
MMPQSVAFDLDGVLVNSEPLYQASFVEAVSSMDRPELADWFPHTLGRRTSDYLPELANELERPVTQVEIALDLALRRVLEEDHLEPMPGAIEALAVLGTGGRILGLASSSPRWFIDRVLDELGIADQFQAISAGDEVERGKPDPALYRLVARRMTVSPRDCVAVEDTPVGATSALAAGMMVIAVPNPLTVGFDHSAAQAVVPDLMAAASLITTLDPEHQREAQ